MLTPRGALGKSLTCLRPRTLVCKEGLATLWGKWAYNEARKPYAGDSAA